MEFDLAQYISDNPSLVPSGGMLGVVLILVKWFLKRAALGFETLERLDDTMTNMQHSLFGVRGDNGLVSEVKELAQCNKANKKHLARHDNQLTRITSKLEK